MRTFAFFLILLCARSQQPRARVAFWLKTAEAQTFCPSLPSLVFSLGGLWDQLPYQDTRLMGSLHILGVASPWRVDRVALYTLK